jgi:phage/plasmid-like protein (TIGR03299 family)
MVADLEQFTDGHQTVTAFAFAGDREDIWHQLGQGLGRTMTAEEAMRSSHMDRLIRVDPIPVPTEGGRWAIPQPYYITLEGKMFVTEDGEPFVVEDKVVGVHGKGGADAHQNFTMRDRFDLAEQAIHASNGAAVWSTAGMLADGVKGFACMEAPPTIIDPQGIRDIIRNYLTVVWSFDGSRATELGASSIRVVCANTLAMHDGGDKETVIKVKHTSHTAQERFALAARQWSIAQDKAKAYQLIAEQMLAKRDAQAVLSKIVERFEPERAGASKREQSIRRTKLDNLQVLMHSPTNDVGDNAWKAYNVYTEYLDWVVPIKVSKGETEADRRLSNQFDGTYDARKANVADFVLALS